ncbi:MAG: endonuclease III [Myxococcota bacterium]
MPQAKRRPSAKLRLLAATVLRRLSRAIPSPHVELKFGDTWQLLVAVILSAQSTDKMVNVVMPELLARWPTPRALAAATQEDVEKVVHRTGFFRNKAKSIRGMSQAVVERFGGQIPRSMDELLTLPGVARKTANVVLGAAYGVASGITVDTHATRVSQRLGLTRETQAEKIERALCALFPQDAWIQLGHRFVLHGRYVCTARAPACDRCPLNDICPSHEKDALGRWTQRAERERLEMESRAQPFARVLPRP